VNRLEVSGAIVALLGVTLTIFLQPPSSPMMQIGMARIGIGELFAAIGAIASALATIVIKKHLSQVPSGIYSIFRTAIGTLVCFLATIVLYGSDHFMGIFSPLLWKWMLVYGTVIVVLGQSFWVRGLRATTAAMASIVSSFTPIIAILAAYWILGEVPTQAQYIGGSIILIGLVLSQIGTRQTAQRTLLNLRQVEQMKIEMSVGFKGI
jgi:drug/metabolite transporter (DMT)-like permease